MIFRHMNGFDQHTNPSCFLRQPGRILQCRLVMDPERFPDDRDEAINGGHCGREEGGLPGSGRTAQNPLNIR